METKNKDFITVQITLNASIDKVWKYWSDPEHITQWNFASDDWCCPRAENDLRTHGKFSARMEAKDGSMGFDFSGVYAEVIEKELISYKLDDGRMVKIDFSKNGDQVIVSETFEAEGTNSDELQRAGWQAILGNFKKHVEAQ